MTKITKANGHRVNYVAAGIGPPVVLIHGLTASLHCWDALVPELTSAGFRAFAHDLLGHGESDQPQAPEAYEVQAVYAHTESWIQDLHLETPFDLICHSMGGYLGLSYTLDHPENVRRLVLVSPVYHPQQLSPLLQITMQQPEVCARLMESVPLWAVDPLVKLNNNVAAGLPEEKTRQMALDFKRTHPHVLFTAPSIRDLTPDLPRVDQPTLVLWGEHDRTLAPESFETITGMLPNASRHTFPETGHTPHLTRAPEFNRRVIEFLGGFKP